MKNKLRKTGMMIAAAVLLVALAFAGAASASDIPIDTADELKDGLDTMAGGTVDVPAGSLFVNISNANNKPFTLMLYTLGESTIKTVALSAGVTNSTFSNLDDGVYTLFGYYMNGHVPTGVIKMATLSGGSGYVDLVFPQENISSGIGTDTESDGSDPILVVDGIDTIVGAEPAPVTGKHIIFECNAVDEVYNVSNTLQTKLRTGILAHTPNAEITYLNITLTKSTLNITDDSIESVDVIADSENLMTIYTKYNMTDRQNIQVWRIHNGAAEQLQELASGEAPSDGTYKLDGTKGVFIYTQPISLYAISSTASSATQSSPAPFVGLLAGLGAAAVVLARLRK